MVKGDTADATDWISALEFVFFLSKTVQFTTLWERPVPALWRQLIPLVTILNINIVLDLTIHNTVDKIQKWHNILTTRYDIDCHYFNIEDNILG